MPFLTIVLSGWHYGCRPGVAALATAPPIAYYARPFLPLTAGPPMRPLLVTALLLALAPAGFAFERTDATTLFASAARAYEDGHYEAAARLFEQVIGLEPDCARCAHLLGRSYGRLAEQAGWLEAIELAKKTRIALELAVELAPEDPEALRDLIRYYRQAPSFLGGSDSKAEALERRLRGSAAGRTG